VTKLFHIFAPDIAFFGQKDAAQVAVLRRMVRDLRFAVELEVCPTMREPEGLALSSRNRNLSEDERRQALVLYRALSAIEKRFQAGEVDSGRLIGEAQRILKEEPGVQVEYCRIVDPESLEDVSEARPGSLAAIAARVGATRLIDNLLL
jgi:pantoate--beta-alanine ligase